MKPRKITRALALILTLCLLAGYAAALSSVAATAHPDASASVGESTDAGILQVLLNRDFEDGKAPENGGTITGTTSTEAIKLAESDGNRYVTFTSHGNHDYIYYDVGSYAPARGSVVMQMDVMVTGASTSVSGMIQLNPKTRGSSSDVYTVANIKTASGKSAIAPFSSAAQSAYTMSAGEWYTLTMVWSYESNQSVSCTVYAGTGVSGSYTDTASAATGCTDVRPGQVRVGTTASASGTWCMDNLVIYTTYETDPRTAASYTVGKNAKGVMYQSAAGDYVDLDAYDGTSFLKLGVERALSASVEQVDLDAAPFEQDGKVYIPTSALTALGISVTDSVTVEGVPCVPLDGIGAATGGKYHAMYSSMGLIGLTEDAELSFDGLTVELVPIMKRFIFDNITADLKNASVYTVSDMTSLSHPYIFADQTRFDELYAVYAGGGDEVLASYIDYSANQAARIYNSYAVVSGGAYSGLKAGTATMPYLDAFGYDVGGRLNEATTHNNRILTLAFGYQLTRNEDYARLAYDYAIAMGGWEHWGPGHFLNCADASSPYATAYDWLYGVWTKLGLDVGAIEEIIFTHSILPAYYSIHDNGCPWYDPKVASGWSFKSSSNNWNAVCSEGVTVASLALVGSQTLAAGTMLDLTVDGVYSPDTDAHASSSGTILRKDGKSFATDQTDMLTYRDYCEYLINQCLYNLPMNGLIQYAPDGSYIESNSYWSYGTNNFFSLTAALTSATGSDYGLLDTWGIDRTAYYALNTQSGDYLGWNYHDSDSVGAQDTSWFMYLGCDDGLSDRALAGIRKLIVEQAASVNASMYDIIYYMDDEHIGGFELPALQYYMEGIDGYVVRDSWDADSLYAAFIGNTNSLGHGQIDSGSFVYYSNGTRWLCDVGTENYNTYGFWGSTTRYTYYKMNAEGNNTLLLTSRQDTVPYGQALSGFGALIDHGDNEYGAYAVIDNTSVYGGYAESAYRGLLLTNDRRTVVIQDEVTFASPEDAVWTAHSEAKDIILSVDGTVAYLYDGRSVLRMTIVDAAGSGLRFEITDAYDFLLDCTVGPDYSTDNGGVAEDDRSAYKRLVIRCEDVTTVKLAVVIEEVAVGVSTGEVGYEFSEMAGWIPSRDGRIVDTTLAELDFDGTEYGTVDGAADIVSVGGNAASRLTAGTVCYGAYPSAVEYASLGLGRLVAELEVGTGTNIPSGSTLSFVANGGELISLPLDALGISADGWVKITLILNLAERTAYAYADGTLVTSESYPAGSCEALSLAVSASGEGDILTDNIKIRLFAEGYTALDSYLGEESIDGWADASEKLRGENATRVVASVKKADGSTVDIYSFSALAGAIDAGCVVTLYSDNIGTAVAIDAPCTVITNGYTLGATSESLIATVEDGVITYATGSVTVSWVIGTEVVTEIYTGSTPAAYKGALDDTIYELEGGDGTYSYYTVSGWSLTEGGAPAAEREMTVTSENNVFYAARVAYDGAFVTVRGDKISGYTDPSMLLKSYMINGGYDRISLTSDIVYDSTGVSDNTTISKTFRLYLNGYTLDYSSTDTSDHALFPGASGRLEVYGPGEILNTGTSGNLVYQNGYTYFENVTITSPRAVTDARSGYGHFKGCTVNITGGSSAFGVTNRNNAVTDEALMPTLFVDGCTVNIPSAGTGNAAFSVQANSILKLGGGTRVNTGKGYLLALNNSTVGTVSGYDYASGYEHMSVLIGDVSYDCPYLCRSSTNDPSGATYDMSGKIAYCEGAAFVEYPTGIRLASGTEIALTDDPARRYVVALPSDCATVSWIFSVGTFTELWLSGSTPSAVSDGIREYMEKNPPVSGKGYYFSTETVSGGGCYEFPAIQTASFTVSANMTLHARLDFNLYVPVEVSGIDFTGFSLDGAYISVADAPTVTKDGTLYYKITKASLAPHHSAAPIKFAIHATSGGEPLTISSATSVLDYAASVLDSEKYGELEKALIANILKYIDSAYVYAGTTSEAEYPSLASTYARYKHHATASAVIRQSPDYSEISDALYSATVILSGLPRYRFTFAEGYTGSVTFTYTATEDGRTAERTLVCEVKNGKCMGRAYIDIVREPHLFADEVTIVTDTASARYSLAVYYHSTATELGATTNLLNALYAYCECARLYADTLG